MGIGNNRLRTCLRPPHLRHPGGGLHQGGAGLRPPRDRGVPDLAGGRRSAGQDRAGGIPQLVEGLPRSHPGPPDRHGLPGKPDLAHRRGAGPGGPGPTGRHRRQPLSPDPAGHRFGAQGTGKRRDPDLRYGYKCPEIRRPQSVGIPGRPDGQLGDRFLGQVPPGHRVRRRRPAGQHRQL